MERRMTDALAVFAIHRRLSQEAAKALPGEDLSGAACSDRFGAYNWIERRGYCWAHLKRDFQAMAERFGSEWYGCRQVASARRVRSPPERSPTRRSAASPGKPKLPSTVRTLRPRG